MKSLSIILPCYNPPLGWEDVVIESCDYIIQKLQVELELVIVNDGSQKNIDPAQVEKIKSRIKNFKFIEYTENRGKGYALRQGVAASTQDHKIYTDIDFPYEMESLLGIYRNLEKENEVVLGKRGESYYEKTPFLRKVISKFLRWVLKNFLRLPTNDSQCGLKGCNNEGAKVFLDTQIDRFLFDLEFIKLASRRGKKISTVEVELKPNVVFSKVGFGILFREALNFMRVLFRT
ncbi:MAG: glycosyltransferase [Crocinitomicaceae bacterium]|nr:glycosyltransferase [Crocinitomicaceae bacterium]